jgi:hypothetical protein
MCAYLQHKHNLESESVYFLALVNNGDLEAEDEEDEPRMRILSHECFPNLMVFSELLISIKTITKIKYDVILNE